MLLNLCYTQKVPKRRYKADSQIIMLQTLLLWAGYEGLPLPPLFSELVHDIFVTHVTILFPHGLQRGCAANTPEPHKAPQKNICCHSPQVQHQEGEPTTPSKYMFPTPRPAGIAAITPPHSSPPVHDGFFPGFGWTRHDVHQSFPSPLFPNPRHVPLPRAGPVYGTNPIVQPLLASYPLCSKSRLVPSAERGVSLFFFFFGILPFCCWYPSLLSPFPLRSAPPPHDASRTVCGRGCVSHTCKCHCRLLRSGSPVFSFFF